MVVDLRKGQCGVRVGMGSRESQGRRITRKHYVHVGIVRELTRKKTVRSLMQRGAAEPGSLEMAKCEGSRK